MSFSEDSAPTTGEYRIQLQDQRRSGNRWKAWGVLAGATVATLTVLLTLNAVGPCRSSWAFADAEENKRAHESMSKGIESNSAAIGSIKTDVENTNKRAARIQCILEAENSFDRRDCKRRHRVP